MPFSSLRVIYAHPLYKMQYSLPFPIKSIQTILSPSQITHKMADVQGGIKLFGATIKLQEKKLEEKHEEKRSTTTDDQTIDKMPDKIIPCPRCNSMETKFCYFNNYNVNQPRHFCKGCQRYWTAGGALRNVPVGAGRRKAKAAASCRGMLGFSESCLYDSSVGMHQLDQLDHGMVEWSLAGIGQGSFEHVLPVKRRRSSSNGQTAC